MKTIGSILKEERSKKKLSLKQLEKETKIKKAFIEQIENDDWEKLPEYPIVSGFIKAIAKSLNYSEQSASAILRRDYPFDRKKVMLSPKPDLKLKISISPKIIIAIVTSFLVLFFSAYLVYQYREYSAPPRLEVVSPSEGQEVETGDFSVSGIIDEDATLTVNNQTMLVDAEGKFSGNLEVDEKTNRMVFVARSRYGKETVVIVGIVPKEN